MWTAIASLAADLFGKLIAPILGFLTSWRAERTARDLGRAEQGRADAEAAITETRKANEARSGGRSDAELDDLLRGSRPRPDRQ